MIGPLRFTIVDSPLDRMLVAGTERGLSFLGFGDSDDALEAALGDEYLAVEIQRADSALRSWITTLRRYLDGEQTQLDLPLDVPATAFQRRVWEALQAIPYGNTRTYRQIAQSLGSPAAVRAVGRACATNPVSLVIPCHRAIRQDGGLAGYRWGVERKRRLLQYERKMIGGMTQPRFSETYYL